MTLDQLWFSLSFLFVDNEVDYKKIAKEISNYDIKVIKFQLFIMLHQFALKILNKRFLQFGVVLIKRS